MKKFVRVLSKHSACVESGGGERVFLFLHGNSARGSHFIQEAGSEIAIAAWAVGSPPSPGMRVFGKSPCLGLSPASTSSCCCDDAKKDVDGRVEPGHRVVWWTVNPMAHRARFASAGP